MLFYWYKIANLNDFLATELVQQKILTFLEGFGEADFILTRGNRVNIQYDDTFLCVDGPYNPHMRNGYACYLNPETKDIYWGMPA